MPQDNANRASVSSYLLDTALAIFLGPRRPLLNYQLKHLPLQMFWNAPAQNSSHLLTFAARNRGRAANVRERLVRSFRGGPHFAINRTGPSRPEGSGCKLATSWSWKRSPYLAISAL